MDKVYNTDQRQFIVYYENKSKQKTNVCVIFLHGLLSSMNSKKAVFLENYCQKYDYNYIKFDNFGHGNSTGNIREQNVSSWFSGLELIINKLKLKEIILVASSMGGWLALLAAKKYPDIIKGIIGLAPAPDFTHETVWKKLTPKEQEKMKTKGWLRVGLYPVSYQLIEDGERHLLLDKEVININCAVHLIHGMQDKDISYKYSLLLSEKITSKNLVVKLVKDADHRLSRSSDLDIIANSLTEIITQL